MSKRGPQDRRVVQVTFFRLPGLIISLNFELWLA
jgi:hypothetical protein